MLAVAVIAATLLYENYLANPWTRDGQVQANVLQITPQVSGPISKLHISDNQKVRQGTVLLEINPEPFQLKVSSAQQQVRLNEQKLVAMTSQRKTHQDAIALATDTLQLTKDNYQRHKDLFTKNAIGAESLETSLVNYRKSLHSLQEAQSQLKTLDLQINTQKVLIDVSKAALNQARYQLQQTRILSPIDGIVSNMNLTPGSYASAGKPLLAIIDSNTFRVTGYFKETSLYAITPGTPARITLMLHSDTPLAGIVESIGRGIAQTNGSSGNNLLPQVNPTFDWVRLAQRIPVRIKLKNPPANIPLIVGTTASIAILPAQKPAKSAVTAHDNP